jgi:hypothetical protein
MLKETWWLIDCGQWDLERVSDVLHQAGNGAHAGGRSTSFLGVGTEEHSLSQPMAVQQEA